ncbi:hypothetical protein AVEN_190016-1, partial [Araneus ventricosus]
TKDHGAPGPTVPGMTAADSNGPISQSECSVEWPAIKVIRVSNVRSQIITLSQRRLHFLTDEIFLLKRD